MNPRLRTVLVAVAVCAAAAIAGTLAAASRDAATLPPDPSAGWAGAVRPPGARVPDFTLRDQDGRRLTAASLRGQPVVFTFVYSTCEDTCPLLVQQIRGALDDLGRDARVVGISVDPANDTPQRARRFLLEQHMTGRMTFLLGSREELAPVWSGFGVAPQEEHREHSAAVVLVDAAGRQRIGFPAAKLTVDGLTADLRRLGV